MPTKGYTINLSSIDKDDWEKVGGKAANLGELKRLGFLVPEGFVITTESYGQFLRENGLIETISNIMANANLEDPSSIEKTSNEIRRCFENSEVPKEVAGEIKKEYGCLPINYVAIRSSATSEDLPEESFAGQMETFLNVEGTENVLRCVKNCYASLWSARAIAYRSRNKLSHANLKMAVIVQAMVKAKSAGIIFTVDPISSDNTRLIIESNFGLGESLVSGRVVPDRFIVARAPDGKEDGLRIIGREIGTKKIVTKEVFSKDVYGIEDIELDVKRQSLPSLNDQEIIKLAELGCAIEKAFGRPQDIEWAIDENGNIFVLQTRPITTLVRAGPEDDVVWSRGYSDDYWNDPVSPLFFGLLGDQLTNIVNVELNKIMGYFEPGSKKTDQLLRLHRAHAYFNLEVLKKKVEYEIPPFLRNEDILNYFPDGSGPYGKDTIKKLPFRLRKRVVAELRVMVYDPKGSVTKTASAYEKWTKEVFNPFWDNFESRMKELAEKRSLSEYMSLAEELDELMTAHFRLVRYGIPVHNIGMNLLVQYLLTRFLGKEEALRIYPILISGLKHKTSETNERINQLALKAKSSPKIKKRILETPSNRLLEALSFTEEMESQDFVREFNKFIEDFGVRGFTREPYYPRWFEAPQYVFDILKSLVEEGYGGIVNENENLRKRNEVEEETKRKIKGLRFGWFKWKLFSIILGFARKYIIFREDQRFNLDRWITMNRMIYLEIGKIIQSQGILQDPQEIFFLTKEEVQKIALGAYGARELQDLQVLINDRKSEFLKYQNITPPKFLQGSREFNDPACNYTTMLQGIPASQGLITAPVRVLNSIEEIWQVRVGEILVVPRTDPGWTPVFSKIGGLITETGGILSHGAVVSREYRIPAVTNISNACQIFKTGQVVTIDGTSGVVRVEG